MYLNEGQQTIEGATLACRLAWEPYETNYLGVLAWCCHHEVEIEPLTQPPGDRIAYILRFKPIDEQVVRLNNFRPAGAGVPERIRKAYAELSPARDLFNKRAWSGAMRAAALDLRNAYAEWSKTDRAAAHLADVPNHTWNGWSIFP